MTHSDNAARYTFDDEALGTFNPLEEFSFDDAYDEPGGILAEGPFNLPNPEAVPRFQRDLVSFASGETASERIEALFAQMPTLQRMLFSILDACSTPTPTKALEARIEEMKQHHHCVYAPLTLCDLLERAGALAQTDAAGTPLTEVEQEPLIVEVDGMQFWRVAPAPSVFWSLTEEGGAHLATYQPLELIAACYEAEPQYADIFTTCLKMTDRSGGVSLRAIGDVIDDEPVLQKPKRFAMYFIDKLERAGAVEWMGKWNITEHGRAYLNSLNDQQRG